ncbi:MAG TPA: inositol monophosphatase family protein [Vicinamibacterales bacterium]|nr:inositol monophosphatase family protein [Vicinamibacterales bacterium]
MPLDPVYLATGIEAALAAGRIHRQYFRKNPEVQKKGPIDLVTAADVGAERAFRALIAARFPDHSVLGEEQTTGLPKHSETRCRWIVDPLDGTTNFAHGLALFCVSIALEIDGRVELGVVYDPIADELFTAERGGGARLNGELVQVSQRATLLDGLLCTGFPYSIRERPERQVEVFASFLGQARAVRRLGSAALDLCYVACGRFDGFWERHLHPWDMAAGALIVEEAGGRVTDYSKRPIDLFGGQIVVSNGHLHEDMLTVIDAAGR